MGRVGFAGGLRLRPALQRLDARGGIAELIDREGLLPADTSGARAKIISIAVPTKCGGRRTAHLWSLDRVMREGLSAGHCAIWQGRLETFPIGDGPAIVERGCPCGAPAL
jgi:hypothetical protein